MSRKRHQRRRRRGGGRPPSEEIVGFLRQRHISERNVQRIKLHARNDDPTVRTLADLALEIARVKPYRRRRLQVLASNHWPLFVRCVDILRDGLIFEVFPSFSDPQSDWLWERLEQARADIWRYTHGARPCWCGSGAPYAECCAERDDEYARQIAADELFSGIMTYQAVGSDER